MAGLGRGWTKALAVTVLLIGAGTMGFAQSAPVGSLAGKLTDLHSKALEGVPIVARNQANGAETRTITAKSGAYRFNGLKPGEYALEVTSPQLGRGQVEGIVVAAGHETRVQTAMAFQPLSIAQLPVSPIQTSRHEIELKAPAVNATVVEPAAEIVVTTNKSTQRPPSGAKAPINSPIRMYGLKPVPSTTNPTADAGAEASASQTQGTKPVKSMKKRPSTAINAVTAPVPAVPQQNDPVSPAMSATISAVELQALPVSGRRWQDFVLDNSPNSTTSASDQGQVSFQGASQQPAEITVDGAARNQAFGQPTGSGQGSTGQGGDSAGMAQVGAGGHGLAMSGAAIRAVQTAAGTEEAGASRGAGGRMNVETQSGSNELHGQGFIFDRQNTWGARNPFTQWVKNTGTLTVPVFTAEPYSPSDHEMTWGIGMGSRIRRNKLFWFAALDSYRRNNPGVSTVRHPDSFFAPPTNDQVQVLSARLAESEAKANSDYLGLLENLGQLLGPVPRSAMQWTGFGRLDWEATERHRFTLEGTGVQWNSPGGGLTGVSETYGNHSFGLTRASEEWLLGRWEAYLTPNLLAITQGSVGRDIKTAQPGTPSALEQSFLNGNAWGRLPQIVVDNRYGLTIGNPSLFGVGSYPDEHRYQGQESVEWIRGKLLVKAGFSLSHNADVTTLLRNQTGTYHYASVENFASDALVFGAFGPAGALDAYNQHNCDQTGKVWRDSSGSLRGLGNLPCYTYYSQTMGPSGWRLSTNDWAGYATGQWQANKLVVVSAGLRWEREQWPPPIAALRNPELPLTERLPALGNSWGPRLGVALGTGSKHWPLLRLGYGMYFGRTENAALETALTQTGSLQGDLNFFLRPTDDLPNNGGGAPPFPHVLVGEPGSAIKPGAVEFAPNFHNPEIHQILASFEEKLPGHIDVTASAMVSLGRRLPITIDTNFDTATNPGTITYAVEDSAGAGPIKAKLITVPFYASWPSAAGRLAGRVNPEYQQITQIMSRANSTYEAAMLKVARYGRRGLTLQAHYTYAHAMDWNPNESARVAGNSVMDPTDFSQEYGTSNLDIRHSAGATVVYAAPWKLRGWAGKFGNGWMLSGIWQLRSGRPYTMRTAGALPEEFIKGAAIVGLGPGMNGSGGDNRVYGVGRNTYRYPGTWKADLRLGRRFDLGNLRQLEVLAESFNLLNHQNVTELETIGYSIESGSPSGSLPRLNFLTGLKANTTAFGQPLNINATNFYRERQMQLGLRMRF